MSANLSIVARDLVVDHETTTGPLRALDLPELDVEAGTSLAIMGTSGCGKSTLLGVLAGLAVPSAGSVRIGDDIVTEMTERQRIRFRRRSLGMVYQADNLLPHLTIEENAQLQLAIAGHGDGVRPGGFAPMSASSIFERLGLGGLTDRLPDQLSGGQRQRAAVARAIVHRPTVVLADEPTGSLDEDSASLVIDLLVEVQREIGATLVMVTHDPAMAARADRTIHLGQC